MGGSSTKSTNMTETKSPYAPAIPALGTALSGAQDAYNNTYNGPQVASMDPNVTAGQNQILGNANSGMISGLGQSAGGNISAVLNNNGYADGMQGAMSGIGSSLGQFNQTLGQAQSYLDPYASGAMRNNNPYLEKAIADSMQGAGDAVNRQFSASGRYGSGAHAGALGTSLGQIETGARLGQFNTDTQTQMGAINSLGNLANSGLQGNVNGQGAMAGIGQQAYGNTMTGLNSLGTLNTAQNLDGQTLANIGGQRMDYAQAQIDANNQAPWQKVNNLAQVAGGIGALGGTATKVGTEKTESDPGVAGTIGAIGAGLGGAANFAKLFSDERLKDDIQEVGKLNDGQKVYSYTMKDDPKQTPQIGLLAQEVEKKSPDAVSEHESGFKMVDYRKATSKSAEMGKKKPGQR